MLKQWYHYIVMHQSYFEKQHDSGFSLNNVETIILLVVHQYYFGK